MMLYPSTVVAVVVGVAAWLYLVRGGETPDHGDVIAVRGQIAYRVLSVKTMALNGEVDDDACEVHALATPDYVENSILRAKLRDAAAASPEHWQGAAKAVLSVYGAKAENLVSRLNDLVVQVTAQPACIFHSDGSSELDEKVQIRLMDIAKMWGIGPNRTRAVLEDNNVILAKPIVDWK